jgi:hypothetical protein
MPGHYGDKTMPKKGAKKPGKMMPPGMKKPTKKKVNSDGTYC